MKNLVSLRNISLLLFVDDTARNKKKNKTYPRDSLFSLGPDEHHD